MMYPVQCTTQYGRSTGQQRMYKRIRCILICTPYEVLMKNMLKPYGLRIARTRRYIQMYFSVQYINCKSYNCIITDIAR